MEFALRQAKRIFPNVSPLPKAVSVLLSRNMESLQSNLCASASVAGLISTNWTKHVAVSGCKTIIWGGLRNLMILRLAVRFSGLNRLSPVL